MQERMESAAQAEMRHAYYDGAPGVLVSGSVWLVSALVCQLQGVERGIWALLIGGALIHPLSLLVTKVLGRPAATAKGNPFASLAMASTVWLIVCCVFAYGLSRHVPSWFFLAMLATIGSRYMVFATIFGRSIYWILGGVLIAAAYGAGALHLSPVLAAALGGLIEIVFAAVIFRRAKA